MQVEELHQNGQRMKLNIAINGPEVTSVSSESREATVAYLGFLRLSNTFHLMVEPPSLLNQLGSSNSSWPFLRNMKSS